jgi:hypothetical protein
LNFPREGLGAKFLIFHSNSAALSFSPGVAFSLSMTCLSAVRMKRLDAYAISALLDGNIRCLDDLTHLLRFEIVSQ